MTEKCLSLGRKKQKERSGNMAQDFSKKFYHSKEWSIFREQILLDRSDEEGIKCEKCGGRIIESKHIQLHHIKELTPNNIDDVMVTLNPNNIMILCQTCHNMVHGRYCRGAVRKVKPKKVNIVYGPPMSGKTTLVMQYMQPGDLVVDMDRLYKAMSFMPMYNKPNQIKFNVLAVRNLIIDQIKTRYGNFTNAWIIGGYANKVDRERLARELGAELIYCEADKDDCYYRLDYCNDYRQQHKEEWKSYIDKWFDEFRE